MNTSAKIRRGRVVSPHFHCIMSLRLGGSLVKTSLIKSLQGRRFTMDHGWSPLSHHSHWVTQEWMVPRYSTGHPEPIFHCHWLHAGNWGCWSLFLLPPPSPEQSLQSCFPGHQSLFRLLWPYYPMAIILLQGQTCLLFQVSLDFLLLHSSPLWWKGHLFLVLVLGGLVGLK